MWHADRGRLLLRKPGPVPLGFAYVLLAETNLFSEHVVFFRTMFFENPSVLSRFCLGLNTKVIGSDIHTSVYDKRNNFTFPIVDVVER